MKSALIVSKASENKYSRQLRDIRAEILKYVFAAEAERELTALDENV